MLLFSSNWFFLGHPVRDIIIIISLQKLIAGYRLPILECHNKRSLAAFIHRLSVTLKQYLVHQEESFLLLRYRQRQARDVMIRMRSARRVKTEMRFLQIWRLPPQTDCRIKPYTRKYKARSPTILILLIGPSIVPIKQDYEHQRPRAFITMIKRNAGSLRNSYVRLQKRDEAGYKLVTNCQNNVLQSSAFYKTWTKRGLVFS